MRMERVRVLCLAGCICIGLAGCGNGGVENEPDNVKSVIESVEEEEAEGLAPVMEENDKGESGGAEDVGARGEIEGELVSAGEFVEYYGMEEGEIPEDYLDGFIVHRGITREGLSELNYDVMVRELYERGVTFGKKIADLIAGKEAEFSKEDDFSDAAYVVLLKEAYVDGSDLVQMEAFVLDVENGKVFVTDHVMNDYEAEGNVRELSDEEVSKCLLELRDLVTEEWKEHHEVEGKVFDWTLYVVKEEGEVISFSGEGPDEAFHPGFDKWYGKYLE